MEDFSPILAKRLKQLRESKNLSHKKLSDELQAKYGIKISKESLTNYEVAEISHSKARKNEGMSVKYLHCLADFYQVSTDYLLGIAKEPSRNEDIQAVCHFTGLTADAVTAIVNVGGLIGVLNCLLEHPDINDLLSQIHDLAHIECIKSYLDSNPNSALEETFFPYRPLDDGAQEKIEVYKYRLAISFSSLLESLTYRLIEQGEIKNMVQQCAEHFERKRAKDLLKGDFSDAVNSPEGN